MLEITVVSANWPDETLFHTQVGHIAARLTEIEPFLGTDQYVVRGCWTEEPIPIHRIPDAPAWSRIRNLDEGRVYEIVTEYLGQRPDIILLPVWVDDDYDLISAGQRYGDIEDTAWGFAMWSERGYTRDIVWLHELGHACGLKHRRDGAASVMTLFRSTPVDEAFAPDEVAQIETLLASRNPLPPSEHSGACG